MALCIDRVTFEERNIHTPDADQERYLILTRETEVLNTDLASLIQNSVPRRFWKITGESPDERLEEMTTEEKSVVEAARLLATKADVLRSLTINLNIFIESKYSSDNKMTILALMQEAALLGKMNRLGYFSQVLTYVKNILGYYYTIKAQLTAATTFSQVNDVVAGINIDQFNAADPGVIIEVGMAINT